MVILDKKIPSFLGIFIIATGIIATTFLVKNGQTFQINAGPGQEPKNVEVSNVSDTSFTITYTTDDSVIGSLNTGESSENLTTKHLDERDKNSQSVNKYQTHILTANNLKPDTTYFYTITSGDKTFSNKESYEIKTGPSIGENSDNEIFASGKAINPDGSIPKDAFVIIKINGAQPVSAVLDKSGSFSIPINNLRSFNLNNFFEFAENIPVNIDIFSGNLKSHSNLSSDLISDVPLITLSNDYDFSEVSSNTVKDKRENIKFPQFNSKPSSQRLQTNSPSISPNL